MVEIWDIERAAGLLAGDPKVIETLRQALDGAKQGHIVGVAIVALTADGGMGSAIAAQNLPGLYVGCDKVKQTLFEMMQAKPRSPIVRPGRMS